MGFLNLYIMNELIKISEVNGSSAVSAKELYLFLSIDNGSNFSKWCKINIEDMFLQSVDYQILRIEYDKGRPLTDYALTLDCAKEIAMMSRCENGKQARQYFIECEKKLQKPLSQIELIIQSAQLLLDIERKQLQLESRITEIENKPQINAPIEHFSILGYCHNINKQISFNEAKNYGVKCSQLSKQLGLMTGIVPDSRWGSVKTYSLDVLKQIIE